MRTIRTKVYQFSELSESAKERAVRLYDRYNNAKGLTVPQIVDRLKNEIYQFTVNGDLFNGLTN